MINMENLKTTLDQYIVVTRENPFCRSGRYVFDNILQATDLRNQIVEMLDAHHFKSLVVRNPNGFQVLSESPHYSGRWEIKVFERNNASISVSSSQCKKDAIAVFLIENIYHIDSIEFETQLRN